MSYNDTNCQPPYFLRRFSEVYSDMHKYLALALCIFGAATNLINMVVLWQKSMRNPTNTLLTALSVTDGLMSAVYLPFCLYFTMANRLKLLCPEPYPWQVFLWAQLCAVMLAHTVSSWVTVALAVFRLIYIKLPVRSRQLCTDRAAKTVIACALLASSCMLLPNILGHRIKPLTPDKVDDKLKDCGLTPNRTYYSFKMRDDRIISSVNFWVIGICIKTLPVLLLAVLSVFLIHSLKETARRRRRLKANAQRPAVAAAAAAAVVREIGAGKASGSGGGAAGNSSAEDAHSNRTTKLLVTIVLVSVFSILPQGVIFLVLGSLKSQESKHCFTLRYYDPLGDIFDLMTLFNHSINFIFYYGMSKQFRSCFLRLLFQALRCGGVRGAEEFGTQPNQQQLRRLSEFRQQQQQLLRPDRNHGNAANDDNSEVATSDVVLISGTRLSDKVNLEQTPPAQEQVNDETVV